MKPCHLQVDGQYSRATSRVATLIVVTIAAIETILRPVSKNRRMEGNLCFEASAVSLSLADCANFAGD